MLDLLDGFNFIENSGRSGRGALNKGISTSINKSGLNSDGTQRYSLVISVSKEVMERQGFVTGDKVQVGFKNDGDKKYIFIRKSEKGCTLSGVNGKKGEVGAACIKILKDNVEDGFDGANVPLSDINMVLGGLLIEVKK